MKTKQLLLCGSAAVAAAINTLSPAVAGEIKKPNVLLIIADDFATPLGKDSMPLAKLPELDRLAGNGVRFTRAYCQFPLCGPSRASLLSGAWPAENKVVSNVINEGALSAVELMPQTFRNNGYVAARIGKILHHNIPELWDRQKDVPGTDETELRLLKEAQELGAKAKQGKAESGKFLWAKSDGEAGFTDARKASTAVSWLRELAAGDKPFFLALGFHRPHHPYVAPAKYFDLYPLDKINWRAAPPNHLANVPPPAITKEIGAEKLTDLERRQVIAAYLASESFIDAQVGRVLAELERLKIADKTIVVFVGDHGYHVGDHLNLWGKLSLFNESAGAPMIIRAPGEAGNGRICDRVVRFMDIFPTLAALCQIPPPQLSGRSLVPLLENPGAAWPYPAATFVVEGKDRRGVAITTEDFRYVEWSKGTDGIQLYDLRKDPGEFHNLASDPAFDPVRKDLKQQLEKVPMPY